MKRLMYSPVFFRAVVLLLSLAFYSLRLHAQFVAFNDHAPGAGTSPNATSWDVFGAGPGSTGPLKDIQSGAALPVVLTITRSPSGVTAAGTQGSPAPGTPLYIAFNGYVDFQGTPNPSVELATGGVVTYTFTGLNPNKRYSFMGSSVRGNAPYTDRWTLFEIVGASDFTSAHTTKTLTSATIPSLSDSQAAVNTGVNNTADTGDMVVWENIAPDTNGSFAVTCQQYTGPVPGGSSAGTKGYGMTGIRLQEFDVAHVPAAIVTDPQSQTVDELQPVTFTAAVAGNPAPKLQWYRNDVLIKDATNLSYTISAALLNDSSASFKIVAANIVSNVNYTATSASATLTVNADTNAPTVVDARAVGVVQVKVIFSEDILPSDATNLVNYSITGPNGAVMISGASLDSSQAAVFLDVETLTENVPYTLTVSGLRDQSAAANVIATTQKTFAAVTYAPLDIGKPPKAGAIVAVSGGYNVSGGGLDIGGTKDQFQFGYQTKSGDFDIRVRVADLTVTDPYVKAGLMVRDTLQDTSRFAAVFASSAQLGSFFEARTTIAGSASMQAPTLKFPASYPWAWLRLRRTGTNFVGYGSFDGGAWQQLGTANIGMTNDVFFGLAVTSGNTNAIATAKFRDIGSVANPTVFTYLPAREWIGPSNRRTGLLFSEIMYHSKPRLDGRSLDFIELYNGEPIFQDLTGWRISGGIDFRFPDGFKIQAGQFVVIATDPDAVAEQYGISDVLGPFTKKLSNTSDTLRLLNASGATRAEFTYHSDAPWPISPDGFGHSLVCLKPSYGENDVRAWGQSQLIGGSPGYDDQIVANPWAGVVINEILAVPATGTNGFIELFNASNATIDISGCVLTDGTYNYIIPALTRIDARSFVSITRAQMNFGPDAQGGTLLLVAADNSRVLDAIRIGAQEPGVSIGRTPDGAGSLRRLANQTSGGANAELRQESIVINELMYAPITKEADDEYIELFNRSSAAIDLSGWQFVQGIDFTFPTGVTIPPNGYLVVAHNVAHLLTNYSQLNTNNTVGNFGGKLSGSGERVALAKPVGTNFVTICDFTYGTNGRWPEQADGGGSSLELRDVDADPALAPNWAASDETQKASWATYEITAPLNNANQTYPATKFYVMCIDSGEYLLDDFEISRNSTNYVTNPGLESGVTGWAFYGSHSASGVDAVGAISGSNCLHIRSDEAGDEGPNSVRGSLSATLAAGTTYTMRVKARWLTGWPELLVRVRGNGIELPIALQVPKNLGTPGLPNSKAVKNAGPAITEVTHYPPVPAANQAVVVMARITDPHGVAIPQLIVRPDPATTNFVVFMHDDGLNGDRLAGDGIYSGTIPGRASGTVAFTIRAQDNASAPASSAFPNDAPARECMIRWADPSPFGSLANYHLWSTAASANAVSRSGLERTYNDCTIIYDMRTIYNAGWRNKGSPFHNGIGSYSTSYADDDLLLGNGRHVFRSTGNGGAEGTQMADDVSFWIGEKLGVPFNHGRFMRLYRNGGLHYPVDLDLEVPDRGMAKDWFGGGGLDDTLYKIAGWFEFDDSNANGTASVIWAEIRRKISGNNLKPAAYRFNFVSHPGGKSGLDLTFLLNIVNAANSGDRVNQLSNLADMEQWMRVLAHRRVVGDWDSWSYRTGQNMYMYAPLGQRAKLMSWDMDFVLGLGDAAATDNLFSAGEDAVLQTLMSVPAFQRMLWRAYQDAANGPLLKSVSDPQFDSRRSALLKNNVSAADPGGLKAYVASERSYLLQRIRTADAPTFGITTPSSSTADPTITVTGVAPFGIASIEINGVPYPITWTTARAWSVRVPLGAATNDLNFVGKDLRGNIYTNATGQITVIYTGPIPDAKDWVVINEIMYNAPVNDAEYVELYNSHPSYAFDLSGFKLKGASFTFPNGTFIQPNGYALVVKNSAAFASAYGNTIPLVGQYSGKLANSGDILTLVRPGPAPGEESIIDQVHYENRYPWDPAADGLGVSLQLIDPAQDNWRPANWATIAGATAASPGRVNAVRGTLDPFPPIWINEVLPNNSGSIVDGQGQHDPWIELYNAGADPIDLSLYYLSNDPVAPTQWFFPADTMIAPGAYMLIWADGQPEQSTDTELHTNFRLDPANGIVALNRLQGNAPATVDYLYYSVPAPDLSYGRTLDGAPQLPRLLYVATPGASNDPASLHPAVSINEWMASNISIIKDPSDDRFDDWFELYNGGATAVSLENFVLSDNVSDAAMFRIPHAYSIPAHGYLMVWADNETNENTSILTDLHVPFKLSKSGESIALFTPNGAIVDVITFGPQNDNFSGGRYPDGSDTTYTFTKATPGSANLAPIGLAARLSQISSDGARLTFSWSTITGHSYRIEAKSDLNTATWTPVGSDLTANSASLTATIDLSATSNRIFRVVTLN